MRAFLPFLTCLMLVLTSFSGMAHAADLAGGSIAGVEFTVHTAGDIDQVLSDSDKISASASLDGRTGMVHLRPPQA